MLDVFWLNYLKGKWVPELLEVGNNYIVTKQAYMHEDFPYWKLIRVSKSN